MKGCAFVVAVCLVAVCSLNAQIPSDVNNGSFEQTDPNDPNILLFWQIDPNGVLPEIRQSFSTLEEPFPSSTEVNLMPFDGNNFILLQSDNGERGWPADPNFSRISQKITAHAGERISGVYFFSTGDYLPYDDTATITLIPDPCSNTTNLNVILLAEKSVADVGNYQTMPGWERFTHDFNDADAGTYTLTIQIWDGIDHIFTSRLAVDALKLCYMPLGDINGDCRVDFLDFALLANQWLNDCNSTPCNNADIDNSSVVDFNDLTIMAANWLIDCNASPEQPSCQPPP